ncbi:rab-GTPase-TBC domain-containing protein [Entophlyctis helioformis]|nr:rab-GTPase-TBC domain-containing protein [Entophlyctis helioformis]
MATRDGPADAASGASGASGAHAASGAHSAHAAHTPSSASRGARPAEGVLDEARWSILEGFAHVARLYKETSSHISQLLADDLLAPVHSDGRSASASASDTHAHHHVYSFEPSRVELAHWAHQLQQARSEQYHSSQHSHSAHSHAGGQPRRPSSTLSTDPILSDDDPDLLGSYDLLSHADADSTFSRSPALLPMRFARPTEAAHDVVWDETIEAATDIGTFEVLSTDFAPPPRALARSLPVSMDLWNSWFSDEQTPAADAAGAGDHLANSSNSNNNSNSNGERVRSRSASPSPAARSSSPSGSAVSASAAATWQSSSASSAGRLKVPYTVVRDAIFQGGLEDDVRTEAWKFLFGLYPWTSSESERVRIRAAKRAKYAELKRTWKRRLEASKDAVALGEAAVNDDLLDAILRVEKDVLRTDRNHPFYAAPGSAAASQPAGSSQSRTPTPTQPYASGSTPTSPTSPTSPTASSFGTTMATLLSKLSITASSSSLTGNLAKLRDILVTYTTIPENDDLGFVQGMADLASPILVVMHGDESDAFWCFVSLMERMKPNFRKDGKGMRSNLDTMERLLRIMDPGLHVHLKVIDALNLFFCFRWFLVLFKREFAYADVLTLWDVWASQRYTVDMHFFVALAILDEHRDAIVRHLMTFDEVLKYINDLSMDMRLDRILVRAEQLCLRFYGLAESRGCIRSSPSPSAGSPPATDARSVRDEADVEPFHNSDIGCLRVPVRMVLDRLIRQSPSSMSLAADAAVAKAQQERGLDARRSRAPNAPPSITAVETLSIVQPLATIQATGLTL